MASELVIKYIIYNIPPTPTNGHAIYKRDENSLYLE